LGLHLCDALPSVAHAAFLFVRIQASKERKAFLLELPLRGEIDPNNSTWAMGSVGRIMITAQKMVRHAPFHFPQRILREL